jgi:hypothetical protein
MVWYDPTIWHTCGVDSRASVSVVLHVETEAYVRWDKTRTGGKLKAKLKTRATYE